MQSHDDLLKLDASKGDNYSLQNVLVKYTSKLTMTVSPGMSGLCQNFITMTKCLRKLVKRRKMHFSLQFQRLPSIMLSKVLQSSSCHSIQKAKSETREHAQQLTFPFLLLLMFYVFFHCVCLVWRFQDSILLCSSSQIQIQSYPPASASQILQL